MRSMAIKLSNISKYGRMDAGFHLLMAQHQKDVDKLLNRFSKDELLVFALKIPFNKAANKAFKSIKRGSDPRNVNSEFLSSFRDFEMALYIVIALKASIAEVNAEIETKKADVSSAEQVAHALNAIL